MFCLNFSMLVTASYNKYPDLTWSYIVNQYIVCYIALNHIIGYCFMCCFLVHCILVYPWLLENRMYYTTSVHIAFCYILALTIVYGIASCVWFQYMVLYHTLLYYTACLTDLTLRALKTLRPSRPSSQCSWLSSWVDTHYTFLDNISYYKTESVHLFWGLWTQQLNPYTKPLIATLWRLIWARSSRILATMSRI